MRKIIVIMLTVICVFSASMTCYATTEQLTESKRDVSIDVVADYVKNTSDPTRYFCKVSNGKANATVADGVTVSVSGVQTDELTLVVLPITKADEEAWKWFERCLNGYGTKLFPMDIYFIDESGNCVDYNENFFVNITTAEGYSDPGVFYLRNDGNVTAINCTVDGKIISFETTHNSYYVIAEKTPQTPDDHTSPQTGDNSNMLLWIALLCVSGTALVGTVVIKKRKK